MKNIKSSGSLLFSFLFFVLIFYFLISLYSFSHLSFSLDLSLPEPWIQHVARPPRKIEGEDDDQNGNARDERQPGRIEDEALSIDKMFPQCMGRRNTHPRKLRPTPSKSRWRFRWLLKRGRRNSIGTMWRKMIRPLLTPRREPRLQNPVPEGRNSARTKRVVPIQLVSPITIMML